MIDGDFGEIDWDVFIPKGKKGQLSIKLKVEDTDSTAVIEGFFYPYGQRNLSQCEVATVITLTEGKKPKPSTAKGPKGSKISKKDNPEYNRALEGEEEEQVWESEGQMA